MIQQFAFVPSAPLSQCGAKAPHSSLLPTSTSPLRPRVNRNAATVRMCDGSTPPVPEGNKWAQQSWKTGNQYLNTETIEFTIRPGGIVEEKVTGVKGGVCEKLTENIEAALGTVISTKKTSEYYEVKETITETIDETTDTGSVDGYGGNKWSNW